MTSSSPAVWIPLAVAIVTVIGSFVIGWLDRRGLRDPRIAESAANLGGAFGNLVDQLQEEVNRLTEALQTMKMQHAECEEDRQQLLAQLGEMQATIDELRGQLPDDKNEN